ncbi:MAG: transketolase-like TK C-terminal-containing protein, partial [Nostocoides sp.]
HGGFRPYGGTFMCFTDYARGAMRLSALMGLPVVYVMTHDSIGLGEDGPTHQPIEHLASLRATPGFDVVRPADANETAHAWAQILRRGRPAGLVLSRQNLPIIARGKNGAASAANVRKGGYVLLESSTPTPDVILIATGSEVSLAVAARERLERAKIGTRVVSLPCREWFDAQPAAYREQVLPAGVRARVSIEAGVPMGWRDLVGDAGEIIAIDHFGASAAGTVLFEMFGFTPARVVTAAKKSITSAHATPEGN